MILLGEALTDFKGIERADIAIGPLTVLIGPNNAGKSTVLQALGLLAQSAGTNGLVMRSQALDLGPTPDVLIRRGSEAGRWAIEVRWTRQTPSDNRVAPGTTVGVSYTYEGHRDGVYVSVADVQIEAPTRRSVLIRAARNSASQMRVVVSADRFEQANGPSYPAISREVTSSSSVPAAPWAFPVSLPSQGDRDFTLADVATEDGLVQYALAVSGPIFNQGIAVALRGFRYVSPQRGFFNTAYNLQDNVPPQLDRPDEVVAALAYNRELLEAVGERSRSVLGYGLRTDLIPNRNIDFAAVSAEGGVVSLGNMGAGLGQVAWMALQLEDHLRRWQPTLVGLGDIQPGIGIEEPELHLHPRAQHAMAELLRIYAVNGTRIVLTTQSEHILIALLNQVARGVVGPRDLNVYYIEEGRVEQLAVTERGSLEGGLKGFFEANEDELLHQLDALIRQQGREPPLDD